MKTLVERIRNRELAIENDGSLEELRKVIKHCFPDDKVIAGGNSRYYFAYKIYADRWECSDNTNLPTVSVKEVLAEIEGEGKETIKYYKLVSDKDKVWKSFHVGKIYPETFIVKSINMKISLKDLLIDNVSAYCFKQVSEQDYLNQESKETKVIYLNEEDKPKIEKPLGLINWFNKINKEEVGWHHQNYYSQNKYAEEWLEYRNNFEPNDKPIEFTNKLSFNTFEWKEAVEKPNEFEKIEYRGNGIFWASMNHNFYPFVFKGNLNNGKLK